MKYVEIYPWRVLETVAAGKTVYALDKKRRSVHIVNNAPCGDVVKALEKSEYKERFEYWYEDSEGEDTEGEIPEYEVDNGEF
jgi:hypothetical protein